MDETAPCRVAYHNIAKPAGVECVTLVWTEPSWADGETADLFGGVEDSPPEMVPCEPGLWIWEGKVMRGADALEASDGDSGGGLWWEGVARRMNADEALAVAEDRNPLEVAAHAPAPDSDLKGATSRLREACRPSPHRYVLADRRDLTAVLDALTTWTPVGASLPEEGEPVLVRIAEDEPPAVCSLTTEVDIDGDGPCWRLCAGVHDARILVAETVAWRRLPNG